jgi:hypothetical protein
MRVRRVPKRIGTETPEESGSKPQSTGGSTGPESERQRLEGSPREINPVRGNK